MKEKIHKMSFIEDKVVVSGTILQLSLSKNGYPIFNSGFDLSADLR